MEAAIATDTSPVFVWLDLEMTGLDDATCAIIELGIVITGPDLTPRAELERAIWQPEEVLLRMEPRVRAMHTDNGLLERVRKSTTSLRDAENDALELVSRHAPFRQGILAGNSIHTDRRFLTRYMPRFEGFLHYRQLDVSSLKVLTQAWYPQVPGHKKQGTQEHTALADLRESLSELAHYRASFFRPS